MRSWRYTTLQLGRGDSTGAESDNARGSCSGGYDLPVDVLLGTDVPELTRLISDESLRLDSY